MNEVTLRGITEHDTGLLVQWRNDNARWFPKGEPITPQGHLTWYRDHYLTDPSYSMCLVCVDDTPIGVISIRVGHGSGELRQMMLGNKEYARGGYMRQGMRQLIGAYDLSHYWLEVMPDNEATIRFHQRNGFTKLTTPGGKYENVNGERGRYLIMSRSYDGYWPEVPVR